LSRPPPFAVFLGCLLRSLACIAANFIRLVCAGWCFLCLFFLGTLVKGRRFTPARPSSLFFFDPSLRPPHHTWPILPDKPARFFLAIRTAFRVALEFSLPPRPELFQDYENTSRLRRGARKISSLTAWFPTLKGSKSSRGMFLVEFVPLVLASNSFALCPALPGGPVSFVTTTPLYERAIRSKVVADFLRLPFLCPLRDPRMPRILLSAAFRPLRRLLRHRCVFPVSGLPLLLSHPLPPPGRADRPAVA